MLVFGIETSCDETAAAVVADGFRVLSNVVSSQIDHAAYGGVVPELAARRHVENLPWVVAAAFDGADVKWSDIDGIGVTRGPGLVGALLAGWCYGRGAARSRRIPFVGVNHLEALPTEGEFCLAGTTLDDAAGEAFDKVSTLLGLGYPGGPVIDQLSDAGDPMGVNLPRARLASPFDFSFSGLKAAVRREALRQGLEPERPDDQRVIDLAASFQCAVLDMLEASTDAALRQFPSRGLVVAGGVAANRGLRARMEALAACYDVPVYLSPLELSTDNAAMVAAQAYKRLVAGEADPFDLTVRANWPLK